LALICVLIPALAKIQWVKALAWIIAGYSTLPGFIHLYSKANPDFMRTDFKIQPWLVGGVIYAVGAVIFALKVPEKCIKKKFDIWGASHQTFHICCLVAAGIHFYASLECYHGAMTLTCV
jgi:adiponectin receptor